MSTANDTVRSALSEAVDEVNKLISVSTDPDQARQLHCLREIFFDLWEGAIKAEIDDAAPIYTDAITQLQQSESAAANDLPWKIDGMGLEVTGRTAAVK